MINLEYTKQKILAGVVRSYPFDHMVIDDFLDIADAKSFYQNLLDVQTRKENQLYDHARNGSKRQYNSANGNADFQSVLDMFSSQDLSNIIADKFEYNEPLYPDPTFEGGGLTFSPPGTFLRYHCDFNYSSNAERYRVINAILYLNYDYQSSDGGHLHLIDPKSSTVEGVVEPVFNRCVLFKTNKNTPHGVNRNNNDFTRVSFNCYFYSDKPLLQDEVEPHRTLWVE